MPHHRHFDSGHARFITVSVRHRYPLFKDEPYIGFLLARLELLRAQTNAKILGYVIMPDHVHLVLHTLEAVQLGREIGKWKGRTAHDILAYWQQHNMPVPEAFRIDVDSVREHQLWVRRSYDRNCRTIEEVRAAIEYCHNNPIRRGLARTALDWPWSSAAAYAGRSGIPITIDEWD